MERCNLQFFIADLVITTMARDQQEFQSILLLTLRRYSKISSRFKSLVQFLLPTSQVQINMIQIVRISFDTF
uniref:Uncharacterized protein n=1 Tax=Arundo donax TaxID=35708 RepID=A0A0A9G0P2_ARUDO